MVGVVLRLRPTSFMPEREVETNGQLHVAGRRRSFSMGLSSPGSLVHVEDMPKDPLAKRSRLAVLIGSLVGYHRLMVWHVMERFN